MNTINNTINNTNNTNTTTIISTVGDTASETTKQEIIQEREELDLYLESEEYREMSFIDPTDENDPEHLCEMHDCED